MTDNPIRMHIEGAYDQLQRLAGHRMVTDKVRERIGEVTVDLQKVTDHLTYLEEILPLGDLLSDEPIVTVKPSDEGEKSALVSYIKGKDLVEQRDDLRVLDGFIRWGADPIKAVAHSPDALEIARILGEHFDDLEHFITESYFQLGKERLDYLLTVPDNVDFGQFKKHVFHLFDLGVFSRKPGFFTKEVKDKKRTMFKCSFNKSEQLQQLVRHEWLTAYTTWAVKDFISRNRLSTQLTTGLVFRLPFEIQGEETVDYSLLAYVEHDQRKRLIWMQCMPNNLAGGGQDVSRLAAAREVLLNASKLSRINDAEREMICVIPGNIPNSKKKGFPKTRKRLEELGIQVKTLSELRPAVQKLFATV